MAKQADVYCLGLRLTFTAMFQKESGKAVMDAEKDISIEDDYPLCCSFTPLTMFTRFIHDI